MSQKEKNELTTIKAKNKNDIIRVTEQDTRPRLVENILSTMMAVVILWVAVCVVSALLLAFAVPITEQDKAWASWLTSYSTATHFARNLAYVLMLSLVMLGAVNAIARQTPFPLLGGGMLALAMYLSGEETLVRIGILQGHIKIGCFVYEMQECHEMLGLDPKGFPSRYATSDHGMSGGNAAWYTERTRNLGRNTLHGVPGFSFLSTPFYLSRSGVLEEKLAAQRDEVRRYIEAHDRSF